MNKSFLVLFFKKEPLILVGFPDPSELGRPEAQSKLISDSEKAVAFLKKSAKKLLRRSAQEVATFPPN